MTALVLCVDRDNDIGVKTGIKGPIVGREENLSTAMKLGLADPEDADVNTLFSAISLYDDLVKSGVEAEIATICGDANVGPHSDRILTRQLDEVLEDVKPGHAYLVSDGAEDEFIFPMIASRLRVDHVRRVYVKQSPSIESTYYWMARGLRDEKMRKKIFTPIALVLLVFGLISLLQISILVSSEGLGGLTTPILPPTVISLVLGLYGLYRAYPITLSPRRLFERIGERYDRAKSSIVSGEVSIFFNVVAVILFLIGFFFGFDSSLGKAISLVEGFLFFGWGAMWWFILGFLCYEGGKVADAYFKRGKIPRSFWIVIIFFVALGLVILAAIDSIALLLKVKDPQSALALIYFEIILGILIVVAGALIYRAVGEETPFEDGWRR